MEKLDEKTNQLAGNIEFYVVEQPQAPTVWPWSKQEDIEELPTDLVYKSTPFDFANQVRGGLTPDQVYGIYGTEEEAINVAHDLVKALDEQITSLEEKKGKVVDKLQKAIMKMQKEAAQMTKEGRTEQAQALLEKIKGYQAKHQLVEKSKRPIPQENEKEEKKKVEEAKDILKQSKLSSKEYQDAKKLKGFKASDWHWNKEEQLYVKK